MSAAGIRRVSPPQAVQRLREGGYLVQVLLSEAPSADWRRLFYDAQQEVSPDFPPRTVEISHSVMRFRTDAASVEQKIARIDRWLERANQKESAMGARSEEQRRHREELSREQQELAELNARWAKL